MVRQLNGLNRVWSQPAGGGPGQVMDDAASRALFGLLPLPVAVVTSPVPVPAVAGQLWKPASAGAPTFHLGTADWPAVLKNLTREGSSGGMATKIPVPSGHIDWEYGNAPERQYYVDPTTEPGYGNPFSIGPDGEVIITANKAKTPNAGQDFLSGFLCTAGNGGVMFAQKYGYFTSRLKWQLVAGMWPAFWFLSTDNNFQYVFEPDVMENWQAMVGQPHCGIANSGNGGVFYMVPNPADQHVFGLDYRADTTTFYLDGVSVFSQATPANCLDKHIFPIWNIAVGRAGTWAGQPPPAANATMGLHIYEFAAFA